VICEIGVVTLSMASPIRVVPLPQGGRPDMQALDGGRRSKLTPPAANGLILKLLKR
jgi:hypothetical protein